MMQSIKREATEILDELRALWTSDDLIKRILAFVAMSILFWTFAAIVFIIGILLLHPVAILIGTVVIGLPIASLMYISRKK